MTVTYETIRQWCQRFGPVYARRLRRRRGRLGDTWHLDEVFVTIQGRHQYLWRAVDEGGDVLAALRSYAFPVPSSSCKLAQPRCHRSRGRTNTDRLLDQQRMAQAPRAVLIDRHGRIIAGACTFRC